MATTSTHPTLPAVESGNILAAAKIGAVTLTREYDEEAGDYSGPPYVRIASSVMTSAGDMRANFLMDASQSGFSGANALINVRNWHHAALITAGWSDPLIVAGETALGGMGQPPLLNYEVEV